MHRKKAKKICSEDTSIRFIKRIRSIVMVQLEFKLPIGLFPKFQKHFRKLAQKWSMPAGAGIIYADCGMGPDSNKMIIDVVIPNGKKRQLRYLLSHLGDPFSDELIKRSTALWPIRNGSGCRIGRR